MTNFEASCAAGPPRASTSWPLPAASAICDEQPLRSVSRNRSPLEQEAPEPEHVARGQARTLTEGLVQEREDEPRIGHVLCRSRSGLHRLSYAEWGDPDAARVAICIHGLTRQGRDFDALAIALAGHGYRVVCPDLVGRGRSDWLADPGGYGMERYVGDMVTLLARTGTAEIDVVGTSLGGMTGIHLAALRHAPIRRLVVNDIGPLLPWQALERIARQLRNRPKSLPNWDATQAYFREALAPFGPLGDEAWLHLTRYSVAREPDGRYRFLADPAIAQAFRPVMFWNVTQWRYWDAVRCPVLLLRGEHSDLLPRNVAFEMTRRGPDTTLIELPDCGHAPALLDYRQTGTVIRWLMQDRAGP